MMRASLIVALAVALACPAPLGQGISIPRSDARIPTGAPLPVDWQKEAVLVPATERIT
jgi:hypothetical protein